MPTKRRPLRSNTGQTLNFMSGESKPEAKGTRPLPDPSSVSSVFVILAQYICKKIVFVNTIYKVYAYLGALFLVSLLADVLPFPRTPFARKENFLNVYFVKISWGWTLLVSIPFVLLTSMTYCCGKKDQIVRHMMRLVVATGMWYFWTSSFEYIEELVGHCSLKDAKYQTKKACLMKGQFWHSVDISGHCFILIYSALLLTEESRVITSWDSISDMLRDEGYSRFSEDEDSSSKNPLRNLDQQEFATVKEFYNNFTPYIRLLFCVTTVLIVIWDFMLGMSILYFHNMFEKLLGGMVAICVWYSTYYIIYPRLQVFLTPGKGCFKYQQEEKPKTFVRSRSTTSKVPGPKFMGMPLKIKEEQNKEERNRNSIQ